MRGRFYDGQSATAHEAEVEAVAERLTLHADGRTHVWLLSELRVDEHGGEARLSRGRGDARLVLASSDWRTIAQAAAPVRSRTAAGTPALVVGLAVVALVVALFVFVGMPMLSGPLARATPPHYEQRLGDSYNHQISAFFPSCTGEAGQAALARLGDRIAAQADTPFDIHVRAVHAPMANAFALPGGWVIVTGPLIAQAGTADELAAVIAHETAHVARRHGMQAVWRNLGGAMVLDLVVGGASGAGQQAVLLADQVSQRSHGRAAEAEADALGMDYLHAAGLSSEGMAAFFARMSADETRAPEPASGAAEWWMTHPDTRRRLGAARAAQRPGDSALDEVQWAAVRETCASGDAEEGGQRRLFVIRPGRQPAPPETDKVRQH